MTRRHPRSTRTDTLVPYTTLVRSTAAHQHPRRTRAVEPMTVASSKGMRAAIGLVGAGGVFLLLVAQSLLGRYEPATHEVWGWFLPTVMPTLSLIVGVLVADRRAAGKGQDARQAGKPVDDLFFRDRKRAV